MFPGLQQISVSHPLLSFSAFTSNENQVKINISRAALSGKAPEMEPRVCKKSAQEWAHSAWFPGKGWAMKTLYAPATYMSTRVTVSSESQDQRA